MKIKSIFATLLISSGTFVTAQTIHPASKPVSGVNIPISTPEYLGSKLVLNGDIEESIIGNTKYDLQTNTAIQPRLVVHENGSMSAAWTYSGTSGGFADRGTGYNFFDGTDWGTNPSERVESTRTGWPSLVALPGGGEAFVSHTSTNNSQFAKRTVAGSGEWAFSSIEEGSNTLNNVWHRMTVGGADGNTLHVIGAENTHTHADSVSYYMRYSRSTDLGATWDIVNTQIAGIADSISADPWSGDAYNITASGDKVAFVVGSGSRDVTVLESEDNGATWSSNIIVDFPDSLDIMSDLIDTNTVMNEQGAYFGSDGSYQIFYDENDELQVYFGGYYFANTDTTDEFIQLPFSFEIFRWKESYGYVANGTASKDGTVLGYNQLDTAMTIPDFNGDGQISQATGNDGGFADYGRLSKVTHPSITTAANGDLYMTFTSVIDSVNDLQFDAGAPFLKNHTHQMISKSTDNGTTWSAPKDLLSLYAIDNQLAEGVFGNVVINGSKVYVMYQRDETPGIHVSGEEHAVETNDIVVASFDIADIDFLTLTENSANVFQMAPNPAVGYTTVTLNEGFEASNIEVINTLGQVVYATKATGNEVTINTSNFNSGLYILNVLQGSKTYSSKLMVK